MNESWGCLPGVELGEENRRPWRKSEEFHQDPSSLTPLWNTILYLCFGWGWGVGQGKDTWGSRPVAAVAGSAANWCLKTPRQEYGVGLKLRESVVTCNSQARDRPSWGMTHQEELKAGGWRRHWKKSLRQTSSQPKQNASPVKSESKVTQSCLTLCNSVDCSPPGSSIRGIFPGKSTGVGCHFLLQGIFPTQGSNPGLLNCRQMV